MPSQTTGTPFLTTAYLRKNMLITHEIFLPIVQVRRSGQTEVGSAEEQPAKG